MDIKRKKCRHCEKLSLPNRAICYDHWRARQKELRDASVARQKARRAKKTETKHNSLAYLKKEAWKVFSEFIRKKGAYDNGFNRCYTCGELKHYTELHAGHYFHGRLDFDERNVHAQCVRCNKWLSGNLAEYGIHLLEDLGGKGMKELKLDANTKVYTREEIKEIIIKYGKADKN